MTENQIGELADSLCQSTSKEHRKSNHIGRNDSGNDLRLRYTAHCRGQNEDSIFVESPITPSNISSHFRFFHKTSLNPCYIENNRMFCLELEKFYWTAKKNGFVDILRWFFLLSEMRTIETARIIAL